MEPVQPCHMISDASDMLISEGHLGQQIKQEVPGAKTKHEVLSAQNAAGFVAGCALGPFLGPVAQAPPSEVVLTSKAETQSTCSDAAGQDEEARSERGQDITSDRQSSPQHVEDHGEDDEGGASVRLAIQNLSSASYSLRFLRKESSNKHAKEIWLTVDALTPASDALLVAQLEMPPKRGKEPEQLEFHEHPLDPEMPIHFAGVRDGDTLLISTP